MCVWPEPVLLKGIEVPISALLTASISSAGPALLRALTVPRDLTGTIQSDRHYSTGTTQGPVLYCIYVAISYRRARNMKRVRFGIIPAVSVSDPRSDRNYPGGSIMKYKAARAGSRPDEVTFGMFNVRTAAANGVNGIGPTDTMLRPCAVRG